VHRHLDRFSRFCTAHGRESLCFTMDRAPLPLIAPCMGDLDPVQHMLPSAHPSPHRPQSERHIDRRNRFCTVHGKQSLYYTITMGRPSTLKFPFAFGNLDARLIMVRWTRLSPHPKRHVASTFSQGSRS